MILNEIKVGIIGVGNIGSKHLECIHSGKVSGMRAAAICDIDQNRLDDLHKKYPELAVYERYEDMLSCADIDAVIISVPHPLHAKIAVAALKSNKHTLLEKPIDIKISAASSLCREAEKSNRVFGIMLNQRTNSLFQKAREIVKNGKLGTLKRSTFLITNWYRTQAYYDSGSWRATWSGEGGGVLMNQASHNLDLWQWVCGMPKTITAFCNVAKYHDIEVEDEATIYAEYENGATGVFITSTGETPGTNRFEVCGTLGKIVIENGVLKHWRLFEDERTICKTAKEGLVAPKFEYSEYKNDEESAHRGILQNFTNAVLFGEELIAPGGDGMNELTISNAAYLSEWNGNKKITLPFDIDEYDLKLAQKAANSTYKKSVQPTADDKSCEKRWKINW